MPCFNMLMGYDILPTRYDHFNEFFIDSHLNKIRTAASSPTASSASSRTPPWRLTRRLTESTFRSCCR